MPDFYISNGCHGCYGPIDSSDILVRPEIVIDIHIFDSEPALNPVVFLQDSHCEPEEADEVSENYYIETEFGETKDIDCGVVFSLKCNLLVFFEGLVERKDFEEHD